MKNPDSLDKQITQALFQESNSISASVNLKTSIDARIDETIDSKIVSLSEHRKTEGSMKKPNFKWIAAAIAAACVLIPTGVYAGSKIAGYASSSNIFDKTKDFSKLEKLQKDAGFEFYIPESFTNGYAFSSMEVSDVDKLDEDHNRVGSFKEWWGDYEREGAPGISLVVHEILPEASESDGPLIDKTMTIGETEVTYAVSHYKFVPSDYELTPEDEAFEAQPNCYISVGSQEVEETDFYNVNWDMNGLHYNLFCQNSIMNPDGSFVPTDTYEDADGLFKMAEEIIQP